MIEPDEEVQGRELLDIETQTAFNTRIPLIFNKVLKGIPPSHNYYVKKITCKTTVTCKSLAT